MTLPCERSASINETRDFMEALCSPKNSDKVPVWIQKKAHFLLRHYPSKMDVAIVSEREEDILVGFQIFGEDMTRPLLSEFRGAKNA